MMNEADAMVVRLSVRIYQLEQHVAQLQHELQMMIDKSIKQPAEPSSADEDVVGVL